MIHLASCAPLKRTAHLFRWWHDRQEPADAAPDRNSAAGNGVVAGKLALTSIRKYGQLEDSS